MLILIKNATIIAPQSKFHNSKKDILIKNGVIEKIANSISSSKAKIIKSKNLHVSPGWIDLGAQSGEPGYEHRESLETLSATAAAGGYTGLAIFPNTNPTIDDKSSVQYILNATQNHLINYYPIGAISKDCLGSEMTEMIDMKNNGVVAFSDGQKSISSNGLMMRALQYAKGTNSIIINNPNDESLSNGNSVHEGHVSTSLGIKASPSLAEVLMVDRDIQLSKYTDSRLHIHNISTAESLEKIDAQNDKNISCAVNYLNLCLTEESIASFDVNCKVSPPLRSEADRDALSKGVSSGKIDLISSNHVPLEEELKKKEFVYAQAGAIGLQTCFSGIVSFAKNISIVKIISCLAINSRKLLGIAIPTIEQGEIANITIFDPKGEWTLDRQTNLSRSKNSPFWNQSLSGKVLGVVNGKQSYFNQY